MWLLTPPDGRSESLSGLGWTQPSHTTSKAPEWRFFWIASIGLLGLVDLWRNGKVDGSTLSEHIRPWAERNPEVFTLGCVIFWRHILK